MAIISWFVISSDDDKGQTTGIVEQSTTAIAYVRYEVDGQTYYLSTYGNRELGSETNVVYLKDNPEEGEAHSPITDLSNAKPIFLIITIPILGSLTIFALTRPSDRKIRNKSRQRGIYVEPWWEPIKTLARIVLLVTIFAVVFGFAFSISKGLDNKAVRQVCEEYASSEDLDLRQVTAKSIYSSGVEDKCWFNNFTNEQGGNSLPLDGMKRANSYWVWKTLAFLVFIPAAIILAFGKQIIFSKIEPIHREMADQEKAKVEEGNL